jgi:hypothetical protein
MENRRPGEGRGLATFMDVTPQRPGLCRDGGFKRGQSSLAFAYDINHRHRCPIPTFH